MAEAGGVGGERIKLNVGGKLFETNASTLLTAGPGSLLTALSATPCGVNGGPVFIDRDPDIFSALLSLLRSDRLPSSALTRFSLQDIVQETQFYGIEPRLRSVLSPPSLVGYDAVHSATVVPASEPFPSAISACADDGSLWIAHAGQISAYDWNLFHSSTLRTHVDEVASLRRLSPAVAALGSPDDPGVHFYDVSGGGRHLGSTRWSDPSDPRVYKARVTALDSEPAEVRYPLYAAFECQHHENCIAAVDKTTLRIVTEIGRQSGSAVKTAAPGRVVYIPLVGLLFSASVSAGAFGYAGYVRIWDPRIAGGQAVWESCEPGSNTRTSRFGDSMADADVDTEKLAVYKVCWKSGDIAMADIRMLGDDPWVYLEDCSAGLRNAPHGAGSVLRCYKKQVFIGKEEGLEVWSQLEHEGEGAQGITSAGFRRNFMDKEEHARRGMVRKMEGGGDRLFVCRERVEGVEVWETSTSSGSVSLY